MNKDQVMSLIRGGLKWLSGLLIAHGLTQASSVVSALNPQDVIGFILGAFAFYQSHKTHADDSAGTAPPAPKLGGLMVFAAILSLGVIGCQGTKRLEVGGAYAQATFNLSTNADGLVSTNVVLTSAPDFAFYTIDSTFDLAQAAIDAAFKIERDNRAMLWKISPQIKHSLDAIRPAAWDVVKRYAAARTAYIASPNPVGLATLQELLVKAQALSSAATSAVTGPPPLPTPPVVGVMPANQ